MSDLPEYPPFPGASPPAEEDFATLAAELRWKHRPERECASCGGEFDPDELTDCDGTTYPLPEEP